MVNLFSAKTQIRIVLAVILINIASHIFRIAFPYGTVEGYGLIPEFFFQIFADKLRTIIPKPFDIVYIAEMIFILALLFYGLLRKRKWAAPLGVVCLLFLVFANIYSLIWVMLQTGNPIYALMYLLFQGLIYHLPAIILNFVGLFFLVLFIFKEREMLRGFSKKYLLSFNIKGAAVIVILILIFLVGYIYAEDICEFEVNIERTWGPHCFADVAVMKNDFEICDKAISTEKLISEERSKRGAVMMCKRFFAEATLRPELCKEGSGTKYCLEYIAEKETEARIRGTISVHTIDKCEDVTELFLIQGDEIYNNKDVFCSFTQKGVVDRPEWPNTHSAYVDGGGPQITKLVVYRLDIEKSCEPSLGLPYSLVLVDENNRIYSCLRQVIQMLR